MIGNLADDHVRQDRCPWGTLGKRLRWLGSRLYSALASVFLANIFHYQELRGDVFVALAGLLAEQMQILLAGSTMLFFGAKIVLDALPFQVWRQRAASAGAAVLFGICLARGGIGDGSSSWPLRRLFEFLDKQLQLIGGLTAHFLRGAWLPITDAAVCWFCPTGCLDR